MRRTLLPFLLLGSLLLALPAQARVAVSILPMQGWAERLLGDDSTVEVIVGVGQSPAFYEPSGRQLTRLSDCTLLFTVGVPFEAALVPRLQRMFPRMQIVPLAAKIEHEAWPAPGGGSRAVNTSDDPHVWLDPSFAAVLVTEMADAFAERNPGDATGIRERCASMVAELEDLDRRLGERLAPLRGQKLLTYHPALGYFARAYGMVQLAVESGGTEPGARHLSRLAKEVADQSLHVLVVEPQFAPQRAEALARSLGLDWLVVDPLAADIRAELDRFSIELVSTLDRGGSP